MKSSKQHTFQSITAALYTKIITMAAVLLLPCTRPAAQTLLQYVQPLCGTAPSTTLAALKHSEAGTEKNANTIPAVTLPFAMTQWTPETRTKETKCIPPYFYADSLLSGFRGSHWISGSCMQDYGSFTIMPVIGKLKTTSYAVSFSHGAETVTPSYYKVDLPTIHLTAEITSTLRCAVLRFTMQQDDSLYFLIMPNSDKATGYINVNAATGEVWGYNPAHRIYQGWGEPAGFSGYFYFKFEKKADAGRLQGGTFSGDTVFAAQSIKDRQHIGAYIGMRLKKGEQYEIWAGTSFTSIEAARRNFEAEVGKKHFDEIRNESEKTWETALSQIEVATPNEKDKRIFYTALYHAWQHPRLFSDADGSYPKFAGNYEIRKMGSGHYYDDFSMWDIYRAQLPLLEITHPALINEFARSMVLKGQEGNWLPVFPCWNNYTAAMIGDHVAAFLAAAYNKGLRDYDINAAYALMKKNAFQTPENLADYRNGMGRRALSSYLNFGFIPMEDSVPYAFHKKEQVSRTLEYAFDDYALSVVARDLGKREEYLVLQKRAQNYKHLFDTGVKMVRGRYANGNWFESFDADKREEYITEGTPRQYTFYVPHDIPGLAKLMGGTKVLERELDSLFIKNEYWHGNEPGHHIPFLYNYTSSPWKAQQAARKIASEEYSDGPGGLSGNDDAGQMSAWYIFAAMGFYPVNPVSGEYLLCSPLFDSLSLRVQDQKKFQVITHKSAGDNVYIRKMKWNGKLYKKTFITYQMLMAGGRLEIWLDKQPGLWGSGQKSRPSGLAKYK